MTITLLDVVLPIWVVITQWVLLLTLGFFVIVAFRQLAVILRLKDVGSERDGLSIGDKAADFSYFPANVESEKRGMQEHFRSTGKWSLLLFADPGCSSCQTAVAGLEHLAPTLHGAQLLIATATEVDLIMAVEQFRNASVPVARVERETQNRAYRTHGTPFAYVIDPEGVVRAKGIVGDQGALRKLLQQSGLRASISVVPSLQ